MEVGVKYTGEKAGMKNIDRERINQIIYELSKDSEYFKLEQRKKEELDSKARSTQERIQELLKDPLKVQEASVQIAAKLQEYEDERTLEETWIHIDMDMFYAQVEIRDEPNLEEKPVAVGSGVVSTANYVARQYGIRSAMPCFIAKKLCEDLIILPGNRQKYFDEASAIREIFREYDPEFESAGLDEAYLCVTKVLEEREENNKAGRLKITQEIRAKVYDATRLTCSAGIAPNKMLAKIGSEINKPNGQFYIEFNKEEIVDFLSNLSVRKVPFIGYTTEGLLKGIEVNTCRDILNKKLEIFLGFTERCFEFLVSSALGISSAEHPSEKEQKKMISLSKTFKTTKSTCFLENMLMSFSREIAEEMSETCCIAKTVGIILKNFKFEQFSKELTLKHYINTKEEIFEEASKLLRSFYPLDPVRLVGLRVRNLLHGKEKDKDLNFYLSQQSSQSTCKKPGIKLFRQRCPVCNKEFTQSENWMNTHIQVCSTEVLPKKRKVQSNSIHKYLKR